MFTVGRQDLSFLLVNSIFLSDLSFVTTKRLQYYCYYFAGIYYLYSSEQTSLASPLSNQMGIFFSVLLGHSTLVREIFHIICTDAFLVFQAHSSGHILMGFILPRILLKSPDLI
jgi:hypothetical protein